MKENNCEPGWWDGVNPVQIGTDTKPPEERSTESEEKSVERGKDEEGIRSREKESETALGICTKRHQGFQLRYAS